MSHSRSSSCFGLRGVARQHQRPQVGVVAPCARVRRPAAAVPRGSAAWRSGRSRRAAWQIGRVRRAAVAAANSLIHAEPVVHAIQQPLRQQAHRPAGRHAALAFAAGGAGDVQVRPALAFGEARQEAAGGDRAGPAAADVVDVGEAWNRACPGIRPTAAGARRGRTRVSPAASSSLREVVVLAHQARGVACRARPCRRRSAWRRRPVACGSNAARRSARRTGSGGLRRRCCRPRWSCRTSR